MEASDANSPRDPDWERLGPILDRVMHKLRDRDRQLILLRFFHHSSLAEVGEELNVSANAAQKGIERALDRLRALLARHGVTSSAAAIALILAQQTVTAAPTGLAGTVARNALGGAAVAGGAAVSALNILQLINTMKLTASIIGATLLLSVAGTIYDLRATHGDQAALEKARQALAATTERRQELKRGAPAAGSAADALAVAPAAPPAANSAPSGLPSGENQALLAGRALQAAHPEINRAVINHVKAEALAHYLPLFSRLGLTPDQIAQCEQIAVEADPGGFGFGGNGYQYAFAASARPLSQAEAAARLQSVIGAAGFQALQDYRRSANATSFADMVGQAAFGAGEPISPAQSDQLRQIVAANSASYAAGGSVRIAQVDWTQVEQQSARLLTDSQAASLHASVQQLQFNQAWAAQNSQQPPAAGAGR